MPAEPGDDGEHERRSTAPTAKPSSTRCSETRVAAPSVPSLDELAARGRDLRGGGDLLLGDDTGEAEELPGQMIRTGEMLRRSQAWRGRSSARGRLRRWRGLERAATTGMAVTTWLGTCTTGLARK